MAERTPEEIAKGLTKAQARDLIMLSKRACFAVSSFNDSWPPDGCVAAVVVGALRRIGLAEQKDRSSWWVATDLGRAVAAAIRRTSDSEGPE